MFDGNKQMNINKIKSTQDNINKYKTTSKTRSAMYSQPCIRTLYYFSKKKKPIVFEHDKTTKKKKRNEKNKQKTDCKMNCRLITNKLLTNCSLKRAS